MIEETTRPRAMGLVLKYRYALGVTPEHSIMAAILATIEVLDFIDAFCPEHEARKFYQADLLYLDAIREKHLKQNIENIENPNT